MKKHINVPKSEISYTVSSNGGCVSFLIQNSMDGWMVCARDLDRSAEHFESCQRAAFEHVRLSFVNNSLRTVRVLHIVGYKHALIIACGDKLVV